MTKDEMLKDLWREVMKVRRRVKRSTVHNQYVIADCNITELHDEVKNVVNAINDDGFFHLSKDTNHKSVHLATTLCGCNDKLFQITPCLCYQEVNPDNWVKQRHLPYKFAHEKMGAIP